MHPSFPDILTALGQLAATTSSEMHRAALAEAVDAVYFRQSIEASLERHRRERGAAVPWETRAISPGSTWSTDEDIQLRLGFEAGRTLNAIAQTHGRSPLEVANRLHNPLGILTEAAVDEIRMARERLLPSEPLQKSASAAPAPQVEPETPEAPVNASAPVLGATLLPPAALLIPDEPASAEPLAVVADAPFISKGPSSPGTLAGATGPVPIASDAVVVPSQPSAPAPQTGQAVAITVVPENQKVPDGSKPVLTEAEEKTVNSVLAKYVVKTAPKATLRGYIESEKFVSKIRPEVLVWLRAELIRLG